MKCTRSRERAAAAPDCPSVFLQAEMASKGPGLGCPRGLAGRGGPHWLPLTILILGVGCVDLTEPWNAQVASDAAMGAGGEMAGRQPGIDAAGLDGAEVSDGTGQGGAGGGVDGGLSRQDGAADLSLAGTGGAAGATQAALDGGGGRIEGGRGGPDAVITGGAGGAVGGTGGEGSYDAAEDDTLAGGPDLGRADRAPDAKPDMSSRSPDVPNDAPADAPVDAEPVSSAGLIVYYPCEEAGGSSRTMLTDESGSQNHGTLSTGPAPTGGNGGTSSSGGAGGAEAFSFVRGKVGNGLAFNAAAHAYIELPQDLLVSSRDLTIATWVKVESTTSFQRIFDFGVDTSTFMYLTTANSKNTGARFRIAVQAEGDAGDGTSQVLEGTQPIVAGAWTHLGLVLGPEGAALYVNGSLQASSSELTLRAADLGKTPNNFIGRSLFPVDPYLDGEIDEFRIYARALTDREMAVLAGK